MCLVWNCSGQGVSFMDQAFLLQTPWTLCRAAHSNGRYRPSEFSSYNAPNLTLQKKEDISIFS